jgi:hypothetical protein
MMLFQTTGLSFRIRETGKGDEIFDPYRKKWVALTPEEWVRQSLLGYLVQKRNYPASLIAVERGVKVGELSRRFDAVVFAKTGNPWILIECKAPGESLEGSPLGQLLAYQSNICAKYIVLSNGAITRCWSIMNGFVQEEHDFPEFQEIETPPA